MCRWNQSLKCLQQPPSGSRVCVLLSGLHVVLGWLSPLRMSPLREDKSPLAVAGLRWDFCRHPGLLRPRNLLRLLLWRCEFYAGDDLILGYNHRFQGMKNDQKLRLIIQVLSHMITWCILNEAGMLLLNITLKPVSPPSLSPGARSTCWRSWRSSWPCSALRCTPVTSATTGGAFGWASSSAWPG